MLRPESVLFPAAGVHDQKNEVVILERVGVLDPGSIDFAYSGPT
jgi:hypothetical protein